MVTNHNGIDLIGKRLFVLLACLFVVMIGLGITLPVLPFNVELLDSVLCGTGTRVVHAHLRRRPGYLSPCLSRWRGPEATSPTGDMGAVFVVWGLIMPLYQVGATGLLASRITTWAR